MDIAAFVDLVGTAGVIGILAFIVWEYRSGRIISSRTMTDYIERYSEHVNKITDVHTAAVTLQVDRLCAGLEKVVVRLESNGTIRSECGYAQRLAEDLRRLKEE